MSRRSVALLAAVVLLVCAAGCATRTPPPLPATLKYADFMFPAVPQGVAAPDNAADRLENGWRFLQNDDLRNAAREFAAPLRDAPGFFPAQAGMGYVALARRAFGDALAAFDAALRGAPRYVPALVGRGQALLALEREDEALAAFEAALAADPSLESLRARVDVLRFRNLQQVIAAAGRAAAAGRIPEARAAYQRALQATPDSAFLHRDLGMLERTAGNLDAALTHLRRAVELDPGDATALLQLGELLEARQDFAGAESAYRRAAESDGRPELAAKIAAVAERAREARLPAPFRAIPSAPEATRGDLAALIGVRLEALVQMAPQRQVVITDIGGHWAAPWITAVARAGILPPYENHTFQPRATVRRGDLAEAVSRLLALVAAGSPDLRVRLSRQVRIADMSPAHLSYRAVSAAVASGVLPLGEGDRFQVGRVVSGAEAVDAVDRLRTLVRLAR